MHTNLLFNLKSNSNDESCKVKQSFSSKFFNDYILRVICSCLDVCAVS